jgi:hypothetical protein
MQASHKLIRDIKERVKDSLSKRMTIHGGQEDSCVCCEEQHHNLYIVGEIGPAETFYPS